mmetsp:Transcript_22762/g.41151  ORF Transcript_22762/g.41151 Transcript_22762/m.41151 type:complete len:106 (-) Transcript_22762:250-567(-)
MIRKKLDTRVCGRTSRPFDEHDNNSVPPCIANKLIISALSSCWSKGLVCKPDRRTDDIDQIPFELVWVKVGHLSTTIHAGIPETNRWTTILMETTTLFSLYSIPP